LAVSIVTLPAVFPYTTSLPLGGFTLPTQEVAVELVPAPPFHEYVAAFDETGESSKQAETNPNADLQPTFKAREERRSSN
jgi:hypothetical protein